MPICMNDLKKKLSRMGITQNDYAALVGVSRVTVGKWCNGGPVSRHIAQRAERVLARLEKLFSSRRLPSVPLTPDERLEKLRRLVGRVTS